MGPSVVGGLLIKPAIDVVGGQWWRVCFADGRVIHVRNWQGTSHKILSYFTLVHHPIKVR
jgi:hypothetical protein